MAAKLVSRPWRRYFRFSMRRLVLLVLVIGGWLGWLTRSARIQRDAVAAIERSGGRAWYDCDQRGLSTPKPKNGQGPPSKRRLWPPGWLVDRVGIDYFSHPVMVVLWPREGRADEALFRVGQLRRLDTLIVYPEVLADDSLAPLEGMSALKRLELFNTKVGDAGLAHLKGLTGLRVLTFDGSSITDAGLAHVERLGELEYLSLNRTGVSDAGLARLRGLTRLKRLNMADTQIDLFGMALEEFHRKLPQVRIMHNFGVYGED
jgi:internalin A